MTSFAVENDTVVIGNKTYTFLAAPSAAYTVDIKTDETTQASALASAINLDGTAAAYGASHVEQHPDVQASVADGVITLQARVAGYHINGLYLAETLTNGTITGGVNVFASVTSATLGVGELQDWLQGLLDTGQVNADIIREIDEAII
jgi:hypothetical protein